jgi:hypothetical protein
MSDQHDEAHRNAVSVAAAADHRRPRSRTRRAHHRCPTCTVALGLLGFSSSRVSTPPTPPDDQRLAVNLPARAGPRLSPRLLGGRNNAVDLAG